MNPRTYRRTVEVNGRKLFCRETGDRSLRMVFLLHGVPASSQTYRDPVPARLDRFHPIDADHNPKTPIVWGKNNPFSLSSGARAYRGDLPEARPVWPDAAYFVRDDNSTRVAAEIKPVLTA